MEAKFSEKVFLITGASSGIGAATALHLSRLSAQLALVARNEPNLKRIALYCEKSKGIKPLQIIADVTTDDGIARIVQETIDNFGRIDVLINNAGVYGVGGIKCTTMDTYDEVTNTNVRAVFQLTKMATPHLAATKGSIVNISCTSGKKANPSSLAYSVSKAAIDHFTRCLASELASDGIRVNAVSPGFVRTNLLKSQGLSENQIEMITMNMVGKVPLKKSIEIDEVASLIAYLCSDKAESITGCVYALDGGATIS